MALIIFIFVVFPIVMAIIGKIRKNKPQIPPELKNRPIVVEYNPPANLTPIDVGAIFDRNLDDVDFCSVIIDLAVKGYLKIRYISDDDYEFVKLKDLSDFDHPAYKIIFNFLFVTQNTIKLSELENMNAFLDTKRIIDEMQKYLQNTGYLQDSNDKDPSVRRYYLSRYAGIILAVFGILYISLFVIFGGFQELGLSGMFFLGIFCGIFSIAIGFNIIFVIFGKKFYGRLTPLGITTLGRILGFKEFLRATKTNELRLLNAPELKPEVFDQFLPYAMVLGVEKEWAKKFENIYKNPPSWYEDYRLSVFTIDSFANNLNSFEKSFNSTLGISGGGRFSSGFSGGSSGGGSGGGGGRSW
jgi:uncharacterized membrane protein